MGDLSAIRADAAMTCSLKLGAAESEALELRAELERLGLALVDVGLIVPKLLAGIRGRLLLKDTATRPCTVLGILDSDSTDIAVLLELIGIVVLRVSSAQCACGHDGEDQKTFHNRPPI